MRPGEFRPPPSGLRQLLTNLVVARNIELSWMLQSTRAE